MSRDIVPFGLRMPPDLKARVEKAAQDNGRSMNAEVVQRLEYSFTPWKERPWEERMVIDVDRAMLKLLTPDEYNMLLERVKAAGGADAVNGYAATVIRSVEDLKPRVPDGPRLTERPASDLPPVEDKDEIATQLALAVLRLTGRIQGEGHMVFDAKPGSGKAIMLQPLLDGSDVAQRPRTPKIPGQNAPKEGLGAAPKEPKQPKAKVQTRKRKVVE